MGDSDYGGDSSGVDLSSGVVNIFNNYRSFAALKSDGSVVTWGDNAYGVDSSSVDLSSVLLRFSLQISIAALRSDGSVVVWEILLLVETARLLMFL